MKHLPQSWALACLEDCAEFNPRHGGEVRHDTKVSFVPMAAVSEVEGAIVSPSVRPYGAVSKGYAQFRDGDVIFAKITPCMENGKIAVARNLENGIACGSTEFHVLRPRAHILSNYLWRYLRQQSFRRDAEMAMTGAVGQRRVPTDYLRTHEIPLAPFREQDRIVAKIDKLSARSGRAREHFDHLPRLVEKYKQAVLAAAFRGDLTREWRRKYNETDPWRTIPWSRAGTTINGRAFPSGDYSSHGIKLLRPGNLGAGGKLEWNDKNTRFLPSKYASNFPAHYIQGEAILINLTAQSLEDQFLGRVCLAKEEDNFLLNQRIALFRPRGILPKYCLYALKSPSFRAFVDEGLNSGSLIQHIHTRQLEDYLFSVAPMKEQQEVVRRIDGAFAWIDRLASEANRARMLVDHLDQAVLAKAFRGELLPQDPDDEPWSALLERVRAERPTSPRSGLARGRPRRSA